MRCKACNNQITNIRFTLEQGYGGLVPTRLCNRCDRETRASMLSTTKNKPDPVGDVLKTIWEHGSISIEELPYD